MKNVVCRYLYTLVLYYLISLYYRSWLSKCELWDRTIGSTRNFHLGGYSPRGSGGQKPPSGVPGWSPSRGSGRHVAQKLKQFADIVYRLWPQKWSKFESCAQFTSWFLTSVFHLGGLSDILGAHAWLHHWTACNRTVFHTQAVQYFSMMLKHRCVVRVNIS